jgi:hypothetical protein
MGGSDGCLQWLFLCLFVVVLACVCVCVCAAFVSSGLGFVVDGTAGGKARVWVLVGDGELFGCWWMFAGEGVGATGGGSSPWEGARDAVGKSKCMGAGGVREGCKFQARDDGCAAGLARELSRCILLFSHVVTAGLV